MLSTVSINGMTLGNLPREVFRRALEETLVLILIADVSALPVNDFGKMLEAAMHRTRLLHLINFLDTGVGQSPEIGNTLVTYNRRKKIVINDVELPTVYVDIIAVAWNIYEEMETCSPEHKGVLKNFRFYLGDGTQDIEYRPVTQHDLSRIHMDPSPQDDGWRRELIEGMATGRMFRPLRKEAA
jgi:hypothetical protein